MSFFDMYEANSDKLQVIMEVSFHPRESSGAIQTPPKRMYFQ